MAAFFSEAQGDILQLLEATYMPQFLMASL